MRVGCWSLLLLLCEFQCVLGVLVMFLLQMWVSLHLGHKCLRLTVLLGRFFLWWIWSVLPHPFWLLLVESLLNSILEWLLQLVSWDHSLGKFYSSLLLWSSVCLCHWCMLPVCNKMLCPVSISTLLVCVFFMRNWAHWWKEILRTNDCFFLLFVLIEVELCLCGYHYLLFCLLYED